MIRRPPRSTLFPYTDALPIFGTDHTRILDNTFMMTANASTSSHLISGSTALINCEIDRKSTRLNSSHRCISYAVFCLKKKKRNRQSTSTYYRTSQRHSRDY